ncbi:FAD-binding oxidoreductase [Streptomyces zaomyceticus]|uniref:FAD-binding oxidoreductase n=1 Tax=Streptomyces zaomyceticus TaxID=68286 RepID=UPI002F91B192
MTAPAATDIRPALPGEPEYARAAAVFNEASPARPVAALTARTVAEVRAAVRYGRTAGLPVRVHTTGHSAGAARPMDGQLLIRTELGGGVRVDPARRTAWIPAGTRWAEVVAAAAGHGLAAAHGTSPTVGAVGYLLRGGVSLYGRRTGIAANGVTAVEVVTADGEVRRVDAGHEPELLWALRGGGGGLGVVTGVELELFPAAGVVTGAAFWAGRHAERLLERWLDWAADAPREVSTSLRIMNLPPVPEIPVELRSGPVVCVAGAVLAPAEGDLETAGRQADDLLGPLRAVAAPLEDSWAPGATPAVAQAHQDPPGPVEVLGDHLLVGDLRGEGAAALLRAVGPGSASPLVAAELRQLGGALAEPDPRGGALDHLPAAYAVMAAGLPGLHPAPAIRERCARLRAALTPWDTGRTAPGFVESPDQPQGHLDEADIAAVDRVRLAYDPDGLFRPDAMTGTSDLLRRAFPPTPHHAHEE